MTELLKPDFFLTKSQHIVIKKKCGKRIYEKIQRLERRLRQHESDRISTKNDLISTKNDLNAQYFLAIEQKHIAYSEEHHRKMQNTEEKFEKIIAKKDEEHQKVVENLKLTFSNMSVCSPPPSVSTYQPPSTYSPTQASLSDSPFNSPDRTRRESRDNNNNKKHVIIQPETEEFEKNHLPISKNHQKISKLIADIEERKKELKVASKDEERRSDDFRYFQDFQKILHPEGAQKRNREMLKHGNFRLFCKFCKSSKYCTKNTVLLREDFYVQTSVYNKVLTIRKIDKTDIRIVPNGRGQKSHIERR